ncbi:Beta-glucosidase [Actinidia chinensis var. chinensis]|uniref:Beta-glucosidase n=1 Tax=Actinidia chinensis var. chinensis TaxID=1590841 RepID=A0A2R6QWR7_ACTCC|nr:Beta-glucosidase [Actinidia chinensis var. chinensis]
MIGLLGGKFGEVNPNGVKFYNNIIDNLLLKGIQPFVTIAHHDFPQELEDRYGSWLSPLMQEEFAYYANTCFRNFGDREPFGNCSTGNSDTEPLIVMHNLLLAHAKAAKLHHEHFQQKYGGFIGIVASAHMYRPLTDDVHDREAATRVLAFNVAWVFDPLVYGGYPPEMQHFLGNELPTFSPKEKEYIRGSIDFIAVNHYSTLYTKDCIYSSCILGGDRPIRGFAYTTGQDQNGVPIGEPTGMPVFFVVPEGMEEIIDYLKKRYLNKPMFVLENDAPPED